MIFTQTKLDGVFLIDLERREDERGFFARAWCKEEFELHGLDTRWVQANVSYTKKKGTLRGLHYQLAPNEEAKLVHCSKGAVFDVAVDLRTSSPQFKEWLGIELSEDNHRLLYIPEGVAHGYLTLTNNTQLFYLVSQFYAPSCERGVRWDDPAFRLEWPEIGKKIVSQKDKSWPDFDGQVRTPVG
jgi:dTDP-4-dehydrorhamnose 3,5-epimerase